MSVEIDPQELGFQRPFTTEVSQILKIRNANHTPIAFKVKTTAPKQYCVRPNSGRVEPGKEVEVTVLLQAMKQEPPLEAKCRDKFLVQSVAVTSDKEFTNINEIWEHVGQADKSSVQEKKIRVVYLPQGGSTVAATPLRNGTNGITNGAVCFPTPETAPPAYSSQRSPSPEQAAYTPNASAAVRPEDKPSNASSLSDAKASASNPAMPSNPPPAVPLSYDELKEKLAEAQKTIAAYAQEGGLRLRKAAKGETSNETVNQVAHRIQATQGVPLQVVAALCLVSFLLAYLFF
ncbi:VAMP-associated protein [Hyaloscypha variabilis F]|uniref:VAMP-associated protein n=1 Tax=Hyaloscypha variabilis (strain UAMH 11265 / GT02V1 / F) TaxID=1149755 RepID=A0A2J6RZL4_HYAVF|nr:VAMP-associated protein [Hyaloscypha variabilis F]